MSNHIFDYKLSSKTIAVYAALMSVYSNSYNHKVISIKQSSLCEKTGIKSEETVAKHIGILIRLGFIESVSRHIKRNGDYGTYHYTLKLPQEQGNYFYVPRSIIGKLNPVQLRVYLFICKCKDNKTGECWNSYNDFAKALHTKRSNVIATIKELVALKVIEKIMVIKKDGSYSDNHYRLADVVTVIVTYFKKKKNRLVNSLFSLKNNLIEIKSRYANYLQGNYCTANSLCQVLFFIIRGSPFILASLIVPTLYYQEEKILSYIYQHSSYL